MTTLREAAQQTLEALDGLSEDAVCQSSHHAKKDQHTSLDVCPVFLRLRAAITALRAALAEPVQEPQCNPHPKAPHGFLRNASHNEHRYVCECEGWEPYEAGYQAGMEAALAEPVWVKGELPPPYVERSPIQAEPVQEPVAWMVYTLDGKSVCVTDNPADFTDEHRVLPLYTTPPQRKPLTEEEILSVLRLAPPEPSLWPHLKDEAVVGDVQRAVFAIARAAIKAAEENT